MVASTIAALASSHSKATTVIAFTGHLWDWSIGANAHEFKRIVMPFSMQPSSTTCHNHHSLTMEWTDKITALSLSSAKLLWFYRPKGGW